MDLFKKFYDKYYFTQEKLAWSRHKKAWLGFLIVCGVAFLAVLTGIYSIVFETNGGRPHQVEAPGGSDREGDFGPLDQVSGAGWTLAGSATQQPLSAATLPKPNLVAPSAPLSLLATDAIHSHGTPPDARETVGSAMYPDVVTVFSTFYVEPATLRIIETPLAAPSMTGFMYCLDQQRSPIWTPCPLVHRSSPDMVDATEVPGSDVSISAGERGASNPLAAMRLGMRQLWKSIKAGIVGHYRSTPAPNTGRHGHDCNSLEVCALEETNRALHETLQTALELVKMQQELLNEQQQVIGEQRIHTEQMARLYYLLRRSTDCVAPSERDHHHENGQSVIRA